LLRRYGAAKFLRLCNEVRPEQFDATCRRVLGTDIDALEQAFWKDMELMAVEDSADNSPDLTRRK
jgi:hypothetical protein